MSSNPEEGRLRERKEFFLPLLLLALLCIVGLVVLTAGAYPHTQQYIWLAMAAAAAGSVGLFFLYRLCVHRPPMVELGSIVVITVLLVVTVFGYAAPLMDHFKSARPFCSTVLRDMRGDDQLFFYGFYRPNIHCYMHRRVPMLGDKEDVLKALGKSDRIFLIYDSNRKDALVIPKSCIMEDVVWAQIGSRDVLCTVISRPTPPPLGRIAQ